jgi:hypothetical protein
MKESNPNNWLRGYNLQNDPKIVKHATKQSRLEQDPSLLRDYDKRIELYLKKLEDFFNGKEEDTEQDINERKERYRYLIHRNFIINKEDIPESYYEYKQEHRRIHGITESLNREEEANNVIREQQRTIDDWYDYLTETENNPYSTAFKYFVMSSVLKMGPITTEYTFPKRSKNTTEPIPELDREALPLVFEAIKSVQENKSDENIPPSLIQLAKDKRPFDKLYAEALKHLKTHTENHSEVIGQEWIIYTNPNDLTNDLRNKRSYLCIAQSSHATTYTQRGPVLMLYFKDKEGNMIPKAAIATNKDGQVYEVRGTYNANEDIDPEITDILEAKLNTLPNGENSKQKIEDSKTLLSIQLKLKRQRPLNKQELKFIYEIDRPIDIFGYQNSKNEIIQNIKSTRNKTEDARIVLSDTDTPLRPEQIATNKDEVNEDTKVYIGQLYPNIFKQLPSTIEHIYTSFPEGKVYIKEIEIPKEEKSPQQHEQEIKSQGTQMSQWGEDVLKGANLKEGLGKKIKLIIPTVASLGFPNGAIRQQIQDRAKELGIASKLLPAIVGIELRKQYTDQPMGEYILIDMETILDRHGYPSVFFLYSVGAKLKLYGYRAHPDGRWHGYYRWAFLAS